MVGGKFPGATGGADFPGTKGGDDIAGMAGGVDPTDKNGVDCGVDVNGSVDTAGLTGGDDAADKNVGVEGADKNVDDDVAGANGGVDGGVDANGGVEAQDVIWGVALNEFAGWKMSAERGMTPCASGIKSEASADCATQGVTNAPIPRLAPQIFLETLSERDCDTLRLSIGLEVGVSGLSSCPNPCGGDVSGGETD
jgi:hypothetical protein